MRFSDPFETYILDQLHDPDKARLHIIRQAVQFFANAIVQHFHDPHLSIIAFMQCILGFYKTWTSAFWPNGCRVDKGGRTFSWMLYC
jgi:hypothetical protein